MSKPKHMGIDLANGPDRCVWIVGQSRDTAGSHWEFQGVFDSEEKAVAACLKWTYWVAPAKLNEPFPDETTDGWPGQYSPHARKAWEEYNALVGHTDGKPVDPGTPHPPGGGG